MIIAYVDPSVMSYTVQAIAGVAIALGVVFGVVWRKVELRQGGRRGRKGRLTLTLVNHDTS